MDVRSKIFDGRVNCDNYLLEMTIGEYLQIAEAALHGNEFQRRRVQGSKTVYALLKEDLQKGCIFPPLVLALPGDASNQIAQFLVENKERVLILDGLQRTHSIIDLRNELQERNDVQKLNELLHRPLRCELYSGMNRIGVLYRMLTLNTGQTPMSLRQQIEMLYIDYAQANTTGLTLIREADDKQITELTQYNFREVIEAFNSYLERYELPFDRADLLENIKGLNNLSKEPPGQDVFNEMLLTIHAFIVKASTLLNNGQLSKEYKDKNGVTWGEAPYEIFKRAQCLTGFGAAIGRLRDVNAFKTFQEARDLIGQITLIATPDEFLEKINDKMLDIKRRAKKIGNSQRLFFAYYFRELLNPEAEHYLSLDGAIEPSYRKFESQTF